MNVRSHPPEHAVLLPISWTLAVALEMSLFFKSRGLQCTRKEGMLILGTPPPKHGSVVKPHAWSQHGGVRILLPWLAVLVIASALCVHVAWGSRGILLNQRMA